MIVHVAIRNEDFTTKVTKDVKGSAKQNLHFVLFVSFVVSETVSS